MSPTQAFSRFNHHRANTRGWVPTLFSRHKLLFAVVWILGFAAIFVWQESVIFGGGRSIFRPPRPCPRLRPVAFNLTDFGGVGDGVTPNTEAFERAIAAISLLRKRGGGQLNVQAGVWLTAPFNLTSHMTLFLAEDAVILGIEDEKLWPLMPPLPSYGYGREHPGPRYGSLIHGENLKDVVITGYNGTIDGQGQAWWTKFRKKLLKHTRGPLVQIMWSSDIHISNITLRNSPFWTLHPYDCMNVTILNVTILAPLYGAPNTDGIDPVENVLVRDSRRGVRIKTSPGRGGYIRDIFYHNLTLDNVRVGIVINTNYSEHPDQGYDPAALPIVENITFNSVHGQGVRFPARIYGSKYIPVKKISFRDMIVGITYKKKRIFQCAFVQGKVIGSIFPAPCENLDRYDEQGRLLKLAVSPNVSDIDPDFWDSRKSDEE